MVFFLVSRSIAFNYCRTYIRRVVKSNKRKVYREKCELYQKYLNLKVLLIYIVKARLARFQHSANKI